MELLSRLTPAETLLLVQSFDQPQQKLLRIAFFELLLRGAFEVKDQNARGYFFDPAMTGFFVFPGKNFERYNYQVHEQIFVPAEKDFAGMSLRQLILQAVNYLGFGSGFHSLVKKSAHMDDLRKQTLEDYLHTSPYSYEGRQLRKMVNKRLRELGKEMPEYLQKDPVEAFEILAKVGGNMLLVEGFDLDLFKNLTEEVAQTYYAKNPNFDPPYFNWKYWHIYPNYAHYFSANYNLMKEERDAEEAEAFMSRHNHGSWILNLLSLIFG